LVSKTSGIVAVDHVGEQPVATKIARGDEVVVGLREVPAEFVVVKCLTFFVSVNE
jgi:hypothetical protein